MAGRPALRHSSQLLQQLGLLPGTLHTSHENFMDCFVLLLLLLLLVSQRSCQALSSDCLSSHPSRTGYTDTALQHSAVAVWWAGADGMSCN
jgi:hypothetical protein